MSDNFWIVPEDVQLSWGKLLETLTGHSNCQLSLTLVIKDGLISHTGQPQIANLQPRNRNHVQSNQSWWSFVRQCQSIGSNIKGSAVMELTVIIDSSGNPLLWTAPIVKGLRCL